MLGSASHPDPRATGDARSSAHASCRAEARPRAVDRMPPWLRRVLHRAVDQQRAAGDAGRQAGRPALPAPGPGAALHALRPPRAAGGLPHAGAQRRDVRRLLGARDGLAGAAGTGDAAVVAEPMRLPRSYGRRRRRPCRAPRRARSAAHGKCRRTSHPACRGSSQRARRHTSHKTRCRGERAAARRRTAVYAADSTRAAEALPTG